MLVRMVLVEFTEQVVGTYVACWLPLALLGAVTFPVYEVWELGIKNLIHQVFFLTMHHDWRRRDLHSSQHRVGGDVFSVERHETQGVLTSWRVSGVGK